MNTKTTLVIMAAGLGSRFGGGIKQLAPVGKNGEIIMDYSVHDALEAGFHKVVFIIRKDIEEDFRQAIGNRIEKECEKLGVQVAYAYQSLEDLPAGFSVPQGRTKPWGTGQAVLCAKEQIHEPFAVINADDYYGKEAFIKLHDFLKTADPDSHEFCMAGFKLKNTLSDNGGVTRGLCQVDESGSLTDIKETRNIVKVQDENGLKAFVQEREVDPESYVSMNMWGLTPAFLSLLEEGFVTFLKDEVPAEPLKAEFLLPIFTSYLLKEKIARVQVLETNDTWFGVTYKEDTPVVIASFENLYEQGVYQPALYSDLK